MRKIEGFSNYKIDREGNIFSHDNINPLKPYITKHGYKRIGIYNDKGKRCNKTIHRLVALTYIPNPNNKPEVNHIDGNKLNCWDWNLEWNTKSENTLHTHRSGLCKKTEKFIKAAKINIKKSIELCKKPVILNDSLKFDSIVDASKATGVSSTAIGNNLLGRSKSTKVGIWKYNIK